ncbi:OsmC family protein [Phenylobacterium sp. J367]|uniref:OsmC family protein n=1 Tax=Phenylobacterium sp. J367 TaxID=2898435 RepID=UPI0021515F45|nr:OsmC family protein [Phenylobacterium sp. J367]MCR5878305.1 OsmC family protein [Phenylobacterium sp. J367]
MSKHRAVVEWALTDATPEDFLKGRYSRGHSVRFEGGHEVPATASPHVVGNRWSVAGAVDPEEMLVAAISNCHMLTFLHVAREAGFVVTRYVDHAEGLMAKTDAGRVAVTRVALRPEIAWAGREPTAAELDHLHHEAHEGCFIANSVTTEIVVEAPVRA